MSPEIVLLSLVTMRFWHVLTQNIVHMANYAFMPRNMKLFCCEFDNGISILSFMVLTICKELFYFTLLNKSIEILILTSIGHCASTIIIGLCKCLIIT